MNGFWKNKTVLVTGVGGFIGSQLVEALLAQGVRMITRKLTKIFTR